MNFNSNQRRRIEVICKYISGAIKRKHAETALEVKERQFRRIVSAFRKYGVESILHGNTGNLPRNKTNQQVINKIVELYRGKYYGLNVSHFVEKLLEEIPNQTPSYSTVRKILKDHNLLVNNRQRGSNKVHRTRNRYEREGTMVQIDGSHHKWFGHQMSCLIAAIDDATGKILGAKFSKTETTFDTMDVIEQIIRNHGLFQMLYSDKAGIYTNHKREGFTSVSLAMRKLEIIPIQADTPQAKGRVERLFRTLQSRLVSELKLKNISTIEDANTFLQTSFIKYFNDKFSVEPQSTLSAYRSLSSNIDLNEILVKTEEKIVQKGETILFNKENYSITTLKYASLYGRKIEIRKYRNGEWKVFYQGEELNTFPIYQGKKAA